MQDAPFDSKAFLAQLTTQPGVYRMIGADDETLYVGKARNLKKRVGSYFLRASGNPRIEAMVDQVRRIEVTVAATEDEALLLECNLIKDLAPRYNVMLRDDKSYPYLKITAHEYPRITFYRGARSGPDQLYGPFASAYAVRESLQTLQKLFRLRPCSDSFFSNRRRPCLQYQIKRCSAPCVRQVTPDDYARDVANAQRLLQGKEDELGRELGEQMERASESLEFELAARLRDQIAALKRVQEQRATTGGVRDVDVIALAPHPSCSCVSVTGIRGGLNLGHRSYFPRHPHHTEPAELLEAFIGQYYLERAAPPEIFVSHLPGDAEWLEHSLSARAQRRVRINVPERGARVRLLEVSAQSAAQSLSTRLAEAASMDARLLELQRALELEQMPRRMECFDISHSRGELTVASCVVFNEQGPLKAAYRKFNIEGVTPGDDYAAIRQAVARRFARVKKGEVQAPDILFIDGGAGQLAAAQEALAEVAAAGIADAGDAAAMEQESEPFAGVQLVAIAKGPTRRPGLEELLLPGHEQPLRLPPDSPALHLVQRIRDEAHRFAITGHRGRREKARVSSGLETIEGLGPARRRALLKSFGGLAQLKRASIDEIAKVQGVSRTLAERVYAYFH
ncbi:MAG TPA: excinuclease ABC subunit UvrC [Nevskiaceae bacterium]|nr:excinuclease ABC subunit UvrC [Nevskiaceae bacterium]